MGTPRSFHIFLRYQGDSRLFHILHKKKAVEALKIVSHYFRHNGARDCFTFSEKKTVGALKTLSPFFKTLGSPEIVSHSLQKKQ